MRIDGKSDVLYLIMGTTPFPNLISAITRIKENGIIVCICTDSTKGNPYGRFKKVVMNRLKNIEVDYIVVDGFERSNIGDAIKEDLEGRLQKADKEIFIELNYTGGTKVMSSAAYEAIRYYNYSKCKVKANVILSYIDPERELMCYEFKKSDTKYYISNSIKLKNLETTHEYTVYDVINTYNDGLKNENKIKENVRMKDLAAEMGSLFCNIDKETYDKHINFIGDINHYFRDVTKDNKKEKGKGFNSWLDNKLHEERLPFKYKKSDEFGFSKDKELYKYFNKTEWLEEYIFSIFLDLKSEGVLDYTAANYEKTQNEEESNFEVDIIAYRQYKLYAVSVTSAIEKELVLDKLYEIKQRAKDLAGDETGMCYINLCWDVDFLKDEIINIWDNSDPQNLLILGAKSFGNLKDEIKVWITRGGSIE